MENVQNGKAHQYFLIHLYQKVRIYTSAYCNQKFELHVIA
jgi:hypothetical protein